MADFQKVAKTSEIIDGEVVPFYVDGVGIAICNINNNYYAFRDECSHQTFTLSDGDIEGDNIVCQYHGAEFNIKSGQAMCLPATDPIEVYELKVDGDDILVKV